MASSSNQKKRASPDSVICIDLTEDDDDNNNENIDNDNDNGDPQSPPPLTRAAKKARAATAAATSTPSSTRKPMAAAAVAATTRVKSERKQAAANKTNAPVLDDDGIEIVEHADSPIVPVARATPNNKDEAKNDGDNDDDDDDVEVVGAKNEVLLPHMRQHCIQCKFDPTSFDSQLHYPVSTLDINAKTCDLCYCYVCDCPVKECESWRAHGATYRASNHCCASDAVAFWSTRRSAAKATGTATGAGAGVGAITAGLLTRHHSCSDEEDEEDDYGGYGGYFDEYDDYNRGPDILPPGSELTGRDKEEMVECRKCRHFTRSHGHGTISAAWCRNCGRVASEEFFATETSKFKQYPMDTYLGKRDIEFRIEARDPRSHSESISRRWKQADAESPEWQYSETEMEHDAFRHHLSPRPSLARIRAMLLKSSCIQGGGDYGAYDYYERNFGNKNDNKNNDGMTVESEKEFRLLDLLDVFSRSIQITASWDLVERKGNLAISVYISSPYLTSVQSPENVTKFLGQWFEIFPFNMSDLSSRVMANASRSKLSRLESSGTILESKQIEETKDELNKMKDEFNAAYEAAQGRLKLVCSNGKPTLGHCCDADISFAGTLRRLYSELLPSSTDDSHESQLLKFFHGTRRKLEAPLADTILGSKMAVFYHLFVRDHLLERKYHVSSIEATMLRLENVGHEAVDFVEGLNVELLEFQRQTLKWALEQETMEGGIQKLFWAKLPDDPARKVEDLYFNPIIGRFRREAPNVVRGGFIAEEMGLGKTVISLALILKNPASAMPASGSPISDLDKETSPSSWDKDLYKSTSTSNKKRGSILSRGTLVICPVSLVGQWIEEAKSKLDDPGLVYPYHGQGRKRDAKTLSKNSIVVTTYQVIASDATHHAKKAGEDYCPPLEQVRWWRIICDEGHSLREGQTQRSKSVLSLVADNKWLVSGTPLNTSIKDLANQFKFLGIEHADEIIRSVDWGANGRPRARRHLTSSQKMQQNGMLQFLLGGIMMRHSQKQKYRGTDTTLMSLPEKTERTIEVSFTRKEQTEYQELETFARDFYVDLRRVKGNEITKYYLKLTQKLMPLRVACAGGKYPLPSSFDEVVGDPDGDDGLGASDDEDEADGEGSAKRVSRKSSVKFSDFAFTSKLKVMIAELEKIRDKDSSCKSLVFSQFNSTLEWLQEELPKHGFQYRTLAGHMSMKQRAKALHEFQSDPPTTIFLLSMRAGAVGINLTQANRVFLMEPCFNPALESQAIGRVHRLGQKREVEIIRLIQKESVESRLLEFLKNKYGSSHEDAKKTGERENDGSSDKEDDGGGGGKVHARKASVGLVGNVMRDKVAMMTDDFDLLFGADGRGQ